jgi:hypothetical protein
MLGERLLGSGNVRRDHNRDRFDDSLNKRAGWTVRQSASR